MLVGRGVELYQKKEELKRKQMFAAAIFLLILTLSSPVLVRSAVSSCFFGIHHDRVDQCPPGSDYCSKVVIVNGHDSVIRSCEKMVNFLFFIKILINFFLISVC